VVTLVLIGVTAVYATTFHKGMGYLKSQGIRALVGLAALFVGSRFHYAVWNRSVRWWLLVGSCCLLALTLLLGLAMGEAKRWLGNENLSLQPAELAKFALLVWLAGYLDRVREEGRERSLLHAMLLPGLAVGAVVGLTLLQPAVGTSFIIAAASLVLFIAAGVRWAHVGMTVLAAAVAFVVAVTCIPYARKRWSDFMHGKRDHQTQSLIAIGSGGPVGKGLGDGQQKFQFLPKMHNDFIFAQIGEEFGFVGSVAVYLLYLVFLLSGMRVSRDAPRPFGRYLAAGITTIIFMYALVHVAVTLGVVPTTGQPLPFVSFGGSALVSNLFATGVLLNISRYKQARAIVPASLLSRRPVAGVSKRLGSGRRRVIVLGRWALGGR
jgi:cell division protein FtsW